MDSYEEGCMSDCVCERSRLVRACVCGRVRAPPLQSCNSVCPPLVLLLGISSYRLKSKGGHVI